MLYFCTCIFKFFYVCIWTIVCNKGFIIIIIREMCETRDSGNTHFFEPNELLPLIEMLCIN